MWLMTPIGFFSIVSVIGTDGKSHPTNVMVRTRSKKHLLAFVQALKTSGCVEETVLIIDTPNADYPYRIVVSRKSVGLVVSQFVSEIHYGNFKMEASRKRDDVYHRFLSKVWYLGVTTFTRKGQSKWNKM